MVRKNIIRRDICIQCQIGSHALCNHPCATGCCCGEFEHPIGDIHNKINKATLSKIIKNDDEGVKNDQVRNVSNSYFIYGRKINSKKRDNN